MAITITVTEVASWDVSTTPRSLTDAGCLTGDYLLVMAGGDDDASVTAATSSTTAGTTSAWTEVEEDVATGACWSHAAWAQVTADGSVTVQVDATGAVANWGWYLVRARGASGIGVHGSVLGSATQSVSLTVAQNSAVAFLGVDFDAGTPGSLTPGSSTSVELLAHTGYTVAAAYWTGQASGTRNYGTSGGSGAQWNVEAVEILEAAATGGGIGSARPGKTWKRRYKHRQRLPIPPGAAADVRADTGLATVGLSADATTKKVAVVAATSSLGFSGIGTAQKVSKSTGVGAVGMAANAVHVDIRAVTALATLGLTSTSTVKKVTPTTSVGTVGLTGTVTAKKVSKNTGIGAAGLAGIVTARKVAPATGRGVVGLQASFAHVEIHPISALGELGITALATVKKRSTPLAAGTLGLTGNALPKKISKSTGVGTLPLANQVIAFKRLLVSGRSPVGLAAWWDKTVTGIVVIAYVEVIGGTTAGVRDVSSTSGTLEASSVGIGASGSSTGGQVEGTTTLAGLPS